MKQRADFEKRLFSKPTKLEKSPELTYQEVGEKKKKAGRPKGASKKKRGKKKATKKKVDKTKFTKTKAQKKPKSDL